MLSGVYVITCLANQRFYIGSSNNFERRKKEHLRSLRKGCHSNKHLQRCFDKYGEENFLMELFHEAPDSCSLQLEQEYLDCFYPHPDCLNQLKGSVGGAVSEEANERRRNSLREFHKESSKGWRQNNPAHGRILSEDSKEKISKSLKEFYSENPDKVRSGENHPLWGKRASMETRDKMSKAHRGKILSEETKKKLRESKMGEMHPRRIQVTIEGVTYGSMSMAMNALGITRSQLNKLLIN